MHAFFFFFASLTSPDPVDVVVQDHLLHVVDVLRARGGSLKRQELLDALELYARGGAFPHNHDVPGRIPVFIDEHGTPCAVGHLLIVSGERALAEEIAATDVHVRLKDIHDARLLRWAEEVGFSVDELAWIQPSYEFYDVELDENWQPVCAFAAQTQDLVALRAKVSEHMATMRAAKEDEAKQRYTPLHDPRNLQHADDGFLARCAAEAGNAALVHRLVDVTPGAASKALEGAVCGGFTRLADELLSEAPRSLPLTPKTAACARELSWFLEQRVELHPSTEPHRLTPKLPRSSCACSSSPTLLLLLLPLRLSRRRRSSAMAR